MQRVPKKQNQGRLLFLGAKGDLLTKEREMGLVREQAEHDQVGVETVKAVTGIGVPVGF